MRLELDNVTAGYGDSDALRDITLVVPPTTVVALLGANGAGKTTLLRVASGLVQARRGQVRIDGADISHYSATRFTRAGVCHVTEGRSIFPSLSVRENLTLFARDRDLDEAIEMAVDAFPKLGQRLKQIAGTMSGGEQQMLALTRAYVSGARTVLLDEVSMGLAPIVVDEIFEFLHRLREQGTSLLLVEQYVSKALEVADHVYVLARGRVTFVGETSEVDGEELAQSYLGASA